MDSKGTRKKYNWSLAFDNREKEIERGSNVQPRTKPVKPRQKAIAERNTTETYKGHNNGISIIIIISIGLSDRTDDR